jgi:hypothetical protein
MASGWVGRGLWIFCAALTASAASMFWAPAGAVELSASGSSMTVSGSINQGDEFQFEEFLKKAGAITTVRLDSGGGNIYSAGVMARLIRSRGMTTVVDASRQKCASACTILFAAGVRRYYLNAASLGGGLVACQGFRGLGFHQGASPRRTGASRYSGEGTAQMIALLYEFGASSAAGLIDNSSPDSVYRPSESQAIQLGIATHVRGS